MHRAYQPITPANNKLLKKRWDERRFDKHRQKVQSEHLRAVKPTDEGHFGAFFREVLDPLPEGNIAKSVIDDKPPTIYMHIHLKRKKMKMEEERLTIIERDNRILLEKMCHIMLTRGSVDNTNFYHPKSLNRMARQQELLRVTHENQAIMRRILSKHPVYSRHQWEEEWTLNKMYMKNIAKYPQWYESAYDQWNKKHSNRRESHEDHDGPGYGSKMGDLIRQVQRRKQETRQREETTSPSAKKTKPSP